MASLRCKWTAGQTLRYVIQRDPYFADPAAAVEMTDPNTPYRAPRVLRLTERVVALGRDGTATVRLSLSPEPGFEPAADDTPLSVTQTVTVTPQGQVTSGQPGLVAPELLSAIFRLPASPVPVRGGVAVLEQDGPAATTKSTTPSHDGLLLQTTQSRRRDRAVFDIGTGTLVRRRITVTGTLSLVMIRPVRRGAADFGRVVPNVPIFQEMILERKDDLPSLSPP